MTAALITGSNRGLGLALCTALYEQRREVVAACRTSSPELDALGVDVVTEVDLGTDAGRDVLASALKDRQVDLLIANAGIVRSMGLDDLDIDGIREQFEVNALGALRAIQAALPALTSGAKICMVSSVAGSIGDNGAGGEYGYRMSKAALNMAGVSLARDLADRDITVVSVHPGRLATAMAASPSGTGVRMPVSSDVAEPIDAARDMLTLLESLGTEDSGKFLTRKGQPIPW